MKNPLLHTSRFQVGFKTLIPVHEYCKLERGIDQCIAIIISSSSSIINEYSCVNSRTYSFPNFCRPPTGNVSESN